jgi:FkbM family methyltransferase
MLPRVLSRIAFQNAAWAQHQALRALRVLSLKPAHLSLAFPRCTMATGGLSLSGLYGEIFCQELYESPKPLPAAPRIVDAGGHLGLASLYFLRRYPDCRLTTYEPNPHLAQLARQTLSQFRDRATLVEAALSTQNGTVNFHLTTEDPLNVTGGIENRESLSAVSVLSVPQLDVREQLREPVDLMKMDVEGHEFELLPLALFEPRHVRNLVIEFHDIDQREDRFVELMGVLMHERGYRVANARGVELSFEQVTALRGCPVLKLY